MRPWIALVLLFALFANQAQAIVLSRLYNFEAGTPIESEQVDAEFNNILDAINGNLNTDNLLAGGVATSDIATAAVTQIKLGAKGQQISTSSELSQASATTDALVPNMVANLTVVSRPVFVGLQAAGDGNPGRVSYRHNGGGATDNAAFVNFQRDVATVNQTMIGARDISNPTSDVFVSLPCSAFSFIDVVSAGPHNYTAAFRVATGDSGIISVENCKLVVFEL